jgi:hypothetical protein
LDTAITWQSRPVFVASTFRDFQAERDHLHLARGDLEGPERWSHA